jgi:heme-degrading monooxygenase HmoA
LPLEVRGRTSQCDALVGEGDHVRRTLAVPPPRGEESGFERAYGPFGEWTRLFRRGDGYLGTELLRRSDDSGEYLAIDRWASRAAYEAFRARWSSEYGWLDRQLEELTEEETPLGAFEALP